MKVKKEMLLMDYLLLSFNRKNAKNLLKYKQVYVNNQQISQFDYLLHENDQVEIKKENTVRIEVQDFGEGIDSKDLDNIWDRYYKVDKEHVRVANGSGIGLNIVKQLLELHGVPYGVKSSKGKGSTFYFEMPIEKENHH